MFHITKYRKGLKVIIFAVFSWSVTVNAERKMRELAIKLSDGYILSSRGILEKLKSIFMTNKK